MTSGYSYRIADRRLVSNKPLPELPQEPTAGSEVAAVTVRFAGPEEAIPHVESFVHSWENTSRPSEAHLRLAVAPDGYVVDYPQNGRFLVSRDGERIDCFPAPGITEAATRHLLLDAVLPYALSMTGDVILHAGAVAVRNQGVAFAGVSGRGKSTLVTHFCKQGAEVVTDDCLVLRRIEGVWHAIPYYEGVRLWPESRRELMHGELEGIQVGHEESKLRIGSTPSISFRRTAVPLRMMVFLGQEADEDGGIGIARLAWRDAFFSFFSEAFHLEIAVKKAIRKQFESLCVLAEDVPAYVLTYPRRFSALQTVGRTVLSVLEKECSSAGA